MTTTKEELVEYRKWFEASLATRMSELVRAVKQTPGFEGWIADCTSNSLNGVGEWFVGEISVRQRTDDEIAEAKQKLLFDIPVSDVMLTYYTLSLSFDVGMYLGQTLIKQCPSAKWQQVLSSKKDVDYGQLILKGTGKVPINPIRLMVTFANGIVSGKRAGREFSNLHTKWKQILCADNKRLN